MLIERIAVGLLETNCYVVACEETKEAIVVDPGADGDNIVAVLRALEVKCLYIVNTHGHADHIGANARVKRETGAGILIHKFDGDVLQDPMRNLSFFANLAGLTGVSESVPDRLLDDGDEIEAGKVILQVVHTPGHTPGSICLLAEGVAFTGDTLFAGGIGRTDLPGGSQDEIEWSICKKLFALDDYVVIYPGHGSSSTIGKEKEGWGAF